MKPLGTKLLETKRLILRPFRLDDAEAVFRNWARDEEVTRYLTWPAHKDVEVTQSVLTDWVRQYEDPLFFQWAIVLKERGDEPIGGISIVKRDEDIRMVHVGYCIGRTWWSQGITSEALERLIAFFFEEVEVNRIESRHDPKNPGSGKVMMKCGMVHEGTMKQADRNNQGICDYSMYGLVKEVYLALKRNQPL